MERTRPVLSINTTAGAPFTVPSTQTRPPDADNRSAENPRATLLFTGRDPAPVREGIVRLLHDRETARAIAALGVEAGKRYFELETARGQFLEALCGA